MLRRAVLIAPPCEDRPAFNLAVLLWREGRKDEAADAWLGFRYGVSGSVPNAPGVRGHYQQLAAQARNERSRLSALSDDPSDRIKSHVPPRAHPTTPVDAREQGGGVTRAEGGGAGGDEGGKVSALQRCLMDLMLLGYRLGS